MRIVVVTTRSPYPLIEGRALRTYNLIREAARQHEIVLCTYVHNEAEVAGAQHMRDFCKEVHAVPIYVGWQRHVGLVTDLARSVLGSDPAMAVKYGRASMRRIVEKVLSRGDVDVLHLDMLHLGELLKVAGSVPTVLVEHNIESELLRRRVENERNPLRKRLLADQWSKLQAYERKICGAATHVVAVSDLDRQHLQETCGVRDVTTVANGVDTEFFQPQEVATEPDSLVFVGGLAWFPNIDAIEYFATDILPRLVARRPNLKLTVVGQIPRPQLIERWQGNKQLQFSGLVDDIRPIVAKAAAFIVPLRIGGGTRLKILDAMAMGKPIVSTAVGCEGLEVAHERNILIADTPEAFAREIERLFDDREFAGKLGRAGRATVEARYRWNSVAERMQYVYEQAIAHRAQPERLAHGTV